MSWTSSTPEVTFQWLGEYARLAAAGGAGQSFRHRFQARRRQPLALARSSPVRPQPITRLATHVRQGRVHALVFSRLAGPGGRAGRDFLRFRRRLPRQRDLRRWRRRTTQIAAALYAGCAADAGRDSRRDPAPPCYSQVTTYHLKSSQLATPCRHDATKFAPTIGARPSRGRRKSRRKRIRISTSSPTTRRRGYFEFGRVPRGVPDQYVRQRVFRCAYLDRTGVDLAGAERLRGRFQRAAARRRGVARARRVPVAVHELQQRRARRARERGVVAGSQLTR